MENLDKKINRYLLCGWSIVALILSVSYIVEVFKGERTILYVLIFNIIYTKKLFVNRKIKFFTKI